MADSACILTHLGSSPPFLRFDPSLLEPHPSVHHLCPRRGIFFCSCPAVLQVLLVTTSWPFTRHSLIPFLSPSQFRSYPAL